MSKTTKLINSSRVNNPDALMAPSITNDVTEGYEVGSLWTDLSVPEAYVCLDTTEGNAIWKKLTSPSTGGGSGGILGTTNVYGAYSASAPVSVVPDNIINFNFSSVPFMGSSTTKLKLKAGNRYDFHLRGRVDGSDGGVNEWFSYTLKDTVTGSTYGTLGLQAIANGGIWSETNYATSTVSPDEDIEIAFYWAGEGTSTPAEATSISVQIVETDYSNLNEVSFLTSYFDSQTKVGEILTEKRWIDGKPIYRYYGKMTLTASGVKDTMSVDEFLLDGKVENIENVVYLDGVRNNFDTDGNKRHTTQVNHSQAAGYNNTAIVYNYVGNKIQVQNDWTITEEVEVEFIFEYTKSTDTAESEVAKLKASLNVTDELQKFITTDSMKNNIGQISWFGTLTAPDGFLVCDGSEISRTDYQALFKVIGTTFGAGDGSTTFKLPDLRNEFVRGASDTLSVGTKQAQSIQSHNHSIQYWDISTSLQSGEGYGWDSSGNTTKTAATNTSIWSLATGGTETRPRNITLLPCIRYEVEFVSVTAKSRPDIYSLNEIKTDKYYLGKPVYRKVIPCPNITCDWVWRDVSYDVSLIPDGYVALSQKLLFRHGVEFLYENDNSNNWARNWVTNTTKISCAFGSSMSYYLTDAKILLEYTKSTDEAVDETELQLEINRIDNTVLSKDDILSQLEEF